MSKNAKILITAGVVAAIGFILYSTMGLNKVQCDVCIEFRGRTACAPAQGLTPEEALASAKRVACTDIASGRDETIACTETTPPKSLSCK